MRQLLDDEIVKIEESNSEKEINFQKNMKMEIKDNNFQDKVEFDGNMSHIDKRNAETYKIINNSTHDEVQFYKNNQNISEEINQEFIHYQGRKENKQDTIIKNGNKHNDLIAKQNILEINSIDRNWQNYPDITKLNKESSRYEFCVYFNSEQSEWINIPIYENNIFTFVNIYPGGDIIPYSEKNLEIYKKIIEGVDPCNFEVGDPLVIYQNEIYNRKYKDQEIVKNPFYDPHKDKGNIIYYVKKLISGNENANVMTIYKNISKIKLNEIIVPYDYLFTTYNQKNRIQDLKNFVKPPINSFCSSGELDFYNPIFQQSFFSYPYLLLYIDEIDGVYDSTSNIINKCFSKVVFSGDWNINHYAPDAIISCPGRLPGFIKLLPLQDVEKEYPQSALGSLSKMTIRLLNPQGEIISPNREEAIIDQVCFLPISENGFDKKCVVIRLKNWVSANTFLTNQIIRITNYNLILTTNDSEVNLGVDYFGKFLNRPNGHTIMNIGHILNDQEIGSSPITLDTNKSGYMNVIFIGGPGYFDDNEGLWKPALDIENKAGEELLSQDLMKYLSSSETRNLCYGNLININMQMHLSFTISTLENNIKKIESQII